QPDFGDEMARRPVQTEQAPKSLQNPGCTNWKTADKTRHMARAPPRPEPADDDHGQVVDRDVDLKLLVVGDAEIVSVEDPSDAGVERRDRERDQLVAEDVDADELGGDVMVADGDEGAADAAADQGDGCDDRA